jgi:hypothetical protein
MKTLTFLLKLLQNYLPHKILGEAPFIYSAIITKSIHHKAVLNWCLNMWFTL